MKMRRCPFCRVRMGKKKTDKEKEYYECPECEYIIKID